ncbi:MAG: glycosyl hydrolase [Niameybacter sp.]|uniref:glycosyl hydrolase n=1 Tax=Niameybacter sp. TaxID=2033640 RepID=UPI002FCBA238
MKKILIGFLLCTVLLVGCNQDIVSEPVLNQDTILTSNCEEKLVDLYIPAHVERGLLEPNQGIYTGAYVENNLALDHDMKKFEDLVGVKQAFRVMQYQGSADVTSRQLLECLANGQTPYIKVMMNSDYDTTPIYHLVSDLKTKYKMPIFIELYPVDGEVGDPEAYKAYYKTSYELIKKHLDQAVVVWSIDVEQVEQYVSYYPGGNMVDWVGLNVYVPQYVSGVAYDTDFRTGIDLWYKTFQAEKPLMLSGVAVSHFSRVDHTYQISEASSLLNYFYETVPKAYPRVRGILYIDVDMAEVSKNGKEDYTLSSQKDLVTTYHQLVSEGDFLSEVEAYTSGQLSLPMKYTVPVLDVEGDYYISRDYAYALFNTLDLRKIQYLDYTDGNRYYQVESLVEAYNTKHLGPMHE